VHIDIYIVNERLPSVLQSARDQLQIVQCHLGNALRIIEKCRFTFRVGGLYSGFDCFHSGGDECFCYLVEDLSRGYFGGVT
jgi:hypothetical protein